MRSIATRVALVVATLSLSGGLALAADPAKPSPADEPPSTPTDLSLRLLKSKYDKASVKGSNPVVVTTAAEGSAYAASMGIPEGYNRFQSCKLTARVKVKSGQIQVGALTRDQTTFVALVQPVKPTKKPTDVVLDVSPMKDVGELLIGNSMGGDGVKSVVEVSRISIGPCT